MLIRLLAISGLIVFGGTAAAQEDCSYDEAALMALAPSAFNDDQDGSGWRGLAEREACIPVAADLIKQYRLNEIERTRSSIMHHEAQLRAAMGENEAAIALLGELVDRSDDDAMSAYHKAEIAFLKRDHEALIAARDELLAVPKPEGFDAAVESFKQNYPEYPPPVWPANLDTVEGLIACFDKPYSEAYGADCRPKLKP